MGFIKAFAGALSGSFADQWKDYLVPMQGVAPTAAVFPAVPQGTNAGRGSNTKGSENIISNGSKIVVPEGMALITLQDGAITGVVAEAGGFIWSSDDPNSKSMFGGDGFFASTFGQSWQRFKYGGQPGSQQLAVFVNLKEIPNNRFGTQNPIRWKDPFLETKMGASVRGTYTLKIIDPILFIKNYVPASYIQPGGGIFDFADMDNDAGEQLFNEVISCLGPTFYKFTKEHDGPVEIEDFQGEQLALGKCLSESVEEGYQWKSDRGLEVGKVAIISLDYDEESMEFLNQARQDDVMIRQRKKMGAAYSNDMAGMMAADSGEAMRNAASNPNGAMMGFMGMNMAGQTGANMMGAATNANIQQQQMQQQQAELERQQAEQQAQQAEQQPVEPAGEQPEPVAQEELAQNNEQPQGNAQAGGEDPYERLAKMKKLLDQGVISQEEFDVEKSKLLGL
ncbi:MAG: SPFH domain-containing protein [Clostridia bacterium]|nr:SPFH domain-containing protein [Clostridia bacterium]